MSNETTLLIKLPSDLKISFQGLCKSRGVSVSAELRRFMIDQVTGVSYATTIKNKPIQKPSEKPSHARVTVKESNPVSLQQKSYKDAIQGDLELSDAAKSAMNASNSRNKKKRKK